MKKLLVVLSFALFCSVVAVADDKCNCGGPKPKSITKNDRACGCQKPPVKAESDKGCGCQKPPVKK